MIEKFLVILVFVLFALFFGLIVGLIKPSLILRWSKKPTRLKVFLCWLLSSVVVILMIVFIEPDYTSEERINKAKDRIAKGYYNTASSQLKKIEKDDAFYSEALILIARIDSLQVAEAANKKSIADAKATEKARLKAEEEARKKSVADAKAVEAANKKAEKERLKAEEEARKKSVAEAQAVEAANKKAEKERLKAEEAESKKAIEDAKAKKFCSLAEQEQKRLMTNLYERLDTYFVSYFKTDENLMQLLILGSTDVFDEVFESKLEKDMEKITKEWAADNNIDVQGMDKCVDEDDFSNDYMMHLMEQISKELLNL